MNQAQRQMADYTLNSVTIVVDRVHGWVDIKDLSDSSNHVFLQGDDASALISEATAFYNEDGNVTMSEAYALFAYPYLDLLGES